MRFDEQTPLDGETPQDELWLISYADLLTLLLGFFVLIVASVPLKQARFERIAAAINGTREAPLASLRGQIDTLVARSPELREHVQTREDAEGLGIEFKDALLFDSGSPIVRAEAGPAIAEIARLLQGIEGRPVTIEGHSDDLPIRTPSFRSNWELSAQRAINVLEALAKAGVARKRMSAHAFAETRPLVAAGENGDLEKARAANRRVVIRVE
jgi:chemotaxis protein MotB